MITKDEFERRVHALGVRQWAELCELSDPERITIIIGHVYSETQHLSDRKLDEWLRHLRMSLRKMRRTPNNPTPPTAH